MTPLKQAAWLVGNPMLLAVSLAALGMLLMLGQRRRAGMWVAAAGALVAYLGSTSLIGNALLEPLERQYPPFRPAQAIGIHDIVVLGSGYAPRDDIPVTGALDADGLSRIVEGVRLAHSFPGARLLVSGGAAPGFIPVAAGYAKLATDLGVQPSSLVLMDRARDTDQEAKAVAKLLGQSPFILVTSAYHMPRAMRLMRRAGANAVPAPTGQIFYEQGTASFGLVPGSRGLRKTEIALHEYLGLAAISMRIDCASPCEDAPVTRR